MSKRQIYALTTALQIAGVLVRNVRTPGARAMHIRGVDARTGGPISVRQAIVAGAAGMAWSSLLEHAFRPLERPRLAEIEAKGAAVRQEVEELRRRYPQDEEALQHELLDAYKRSGLNPFACFLPLLPRTVVCHMPKFISSRNQSVPDRLAGIVVVLDR